MSLENFIFGYGSLISAESRARTGYFGEAMPCTIHEVRREWNAVVPEFGVTAVGIILDPRSSCNGVIFPVAESELPKFDARETGYTRVLLRSGGVAGLDIKDLISGNIWTYTINNPGVPSRENPIAQSYLDVILSACFDFGDEFAKKFILSTKLWDYPWINDRKNPRYPRSLKEVPLASKIDKILEELIPNEFLARK